MSSKAGNSCGYRTHHAAQGRHANRRRSAWPSRGSGQCEAPDRGPDITERKRAEEAAASGAAQRLLRRSGRRKSVQSSWWRLDTQRQFAHLVRTRTIASSAWREGRPLSYEWVLSCHPPRDDRQPTLDHARGTSVCAASQYDVENSASLRDGNVHVGSRRGVSANSTQRWQARWPALALPMDITARKQAEAEIRATRGGTAGRQ